MTKPEREVRSEKPERQPGLKGKKSDHNRKMPASL